MALSVLAIITILLFLVIVGVSFLLFGREWLRSRREEAFSRELDRHSVLVSRLRTASGVEFEEAFRRLAAVPDSALREAILDRAREEDPPESYALFGKAYGDLGITDRYMEEVERSPEWEVRARAAERLGRIGSPKAVPVLLRVIRNIKDEDEDVRGAALRALGRIRDPGALPGLIEALGYPEASLPPRIAEIIVMFGPDAAPLLIGELKNFDSDVRRMWAAEILGWLGEPRAAIPLIESLGDVSPEVRAKAAGSLGQIRDVRAVERLLEMLLSDPIPFVRTRVAQALGAIGHPKVIDHLIHVLKDPEWWVRIRAIEALEQIGRSSFGALLVALEDEDEEVRRRAAMALERMGYVREGIEALEREGFRPDVVVKVGGYLTRFLTGKLAREYVGRERDTVCEDMEIIVRIQRYIKEKRMSFRVGYTPEPLCWTEGPESFRSLGKQRNRWMRGLIETLAYHRAVLFDPKYGNLGWFAYPFFLLFELAGAPVEFFGYLAVPLLYAAGFLSGTYLLLFLTLSLAYGALVPVSAVVTAAWSERTRRYGVSGRSLLRYRERRHIAILLAFALLENLGYRQLTLWWRIRGIWDCYFGKTGWEKFERKGFGTDPPRSGKEAV